MNLWYLAFINSVDIPVDAHDTHAVINEWMNIPFRVDDEQSISVVIAVYEYAQHILRRKSKWLGRRYHLFRWFICTVYELNQKLSVWFMEKDTHKNLWMSLCGMCAAPCILLSAPVVLLTFYIKIPNGPSLFRLHSIYNRINTFLQYQHSGGSRR